MTTFIKLKTMNDSQIQDWLRKVGRSNVEALAIGLVGADEDVKSRVYRNMSERARSLLSADVERSRKSNLKAEVIIANAGKLEKMFN